MTASPVTEYIKDESTTLLKLIKKKATGYHIEALGSSILAKFSKWVSTLLNISKSDFFRFSGLLDIANIILIKLKTS